MNPFVVTPALMKITRLGPMTISRVIGKSPSMCLKPSIHENGIAGVLLCPVGVAASGSHPFPRTPDRSGPTEWRQADGIRGKPGSAGSVRCGDRLGAY